jgi:ABC-type bacteriocin/lantibiotic exporter with double-glycine peptidase domain
MTSLIRHLFRDKTVAAMLLISSFFIGLCALAPSLFVIIVLNKFLASGVTSTLVCLALGAVLLLAFELAFRQNRSTMIKEFNQRVFDPFIKMLKDRLAIKQITDEQFKKVQQNASIIKATTAPGITGWILDWPFVLMFAVILLLINWTAAVITVLFMLATLAVNYYRTNLNITQDSQANIEIFLVGLLTISIISVGSLQVMAGNLDIGLLIGSNILAARAVQGTSKYAKAVGAIKQREQAMREINAFIK